MRSSSNKKDLALQRTNRGHRVLALVTDAYGGYGGIAQYNRDFLSSLVLASSIDTITVLPRIGSSDCGACGQAEQPIKTVFFQRFLQIQTNYERFQVPANR